MIELLAQLVKLIAQSAPAGFSFTGTINSNQINFTFALSTKIARPSTDCTIEANGEISQTETCQKVSA